jgi:nitrate reductase assembly molybdenum cofactor insertion protein NarJ
MVNWELTSAAINALFFILAMLFGVYWRLFKTKLSALREFVDLVDEALKDDKVTDEEYARLFDAFKKLFEKAVK